jgi:hypothetical protein
LCKVKGKAIPLQALTGPEGSRRSRVPNFKTINTWRWKGCQSYTPAAFTRRKYSWYSILLEGELTPGPEAGRIMSMKNSSDTIVNPSCDFPVCSAVPQPLHYSMPPVTLCTVTNSDITLSVFWTNVLPPYSGYESALITFLQKFMASHHRWQ